jgi:hypothetical protein
MKTLMLSEPNFGAATSDCKERGEWNLLHRGSTPRLEAGDGVAAITGYVDPQRCKTAELPVEQATRFETIFNLGTTKKIGTPVPPPLLLRADQVVEFAEPAIGHLADIAIGGSDVCFQG